MARIATVAGLSAVLAAATVAPAAIADQATPGALSAGDRLFPELGNGGYDAQSYDLAFDYLAGVTTMDSSVTMRAVATQALSQFSLDSAVSQVRSVEVNGRPAAFHVEREKLIIAPAKELPRGRAFTVDVHFTADRTHNPFSPTTPLPAGTPNPMPAWQATPDGFAALGQPDREHVIFPSNDYPGDPATYTVRVTTPSDVDAVASGVLLSKQRAGDRVTSVYHLAQPAPTDVVQVAVGHFTEIDQVGPHGLPVRSFIPKDAPAGAVDSARRTPDQIAWLEKQLGRPFPYPTYGTLAIDSRYADVALETATLSTFGLPYFASPEEATVQEHELVHQYFGDTVPVRTWDDMWLSEGHAVYYQTLYQQDTGGKSQNDAMKDLYTNVLPQELAQAGPPAQLKFALGVLFDADSSGALTLYALRNLVGQDTFHRIEQTFYDTFRNRPASTQDYIDVANRVSGQNLDGFFQSWLYGQTPAPMPGHPDWHAQ